MTYRNILVHVDRSAGARDRITAAAELATRFNCSVTGAFVRASRLPNYIVSDAVTPIPGYVLEEYAQKHAAEVEAATQAAKQVFLGNIPSHLTTHWLDIEGDTDDQLVACAMRHDLVILPPEITPEFGRHVITAARIGMASGGPVLVLKKGGYPIPFGTKILVAWNESREAVRALRDAWPFLETAGEIHFLKIGQEGERELDTLMQRQLQDHGCPPAQLHVDSGDAPVQDLIRLHVGKTGADLVVLGLYGHSRLRELVIGGVSRSLLSDPPMPLLMSH